MEKKTYEGGCHCGNVRYKVTTDFGMVLDCNCSICSKKAALLTFVPVDQFEQLKGKDAVTDYQFNRHNIHHLFCSTCGVTSFAWGTGPDGKEMRAINVRCLDDVDISQLKITKFDGKSM
jgi:hypothetical protein